MAGSDKALRLQTFVVDIPSKFAVIRYIQDPINAIRTSNIENIERQKERATKATHQDM